MRHFLVSLVIFGAATANGELINHGIVAPVGQSVWYGPTFTQDADGRPLIVDKLWTRVGRINSHYLFIDALTGKTQLISSESPGFGAFRIFLSRANKLYDTQGGQLVEVDVKTRTIKKHGSLPGRAFSFTEADSGVIWMGIHTTGDLVSFDPRNETLTNHGPIKDEAWSQYPTLCTDEAGWVYSVIRFYRGNVVGYDPSTGERRQFIDEASRKPTQDVSCWRGDDGKAYAKVSSDGPWFALHNGDFQKIDSPKASRVGHESGWFDWGVFPDGTQCHEYDVADSHMLIQPVGPEEKRRISFEYPSGGVPIFSVESSHDGLLVGSTGIPLRIWTFDPQADRILGNWGVGRYGGHVNDWARLGKKLYGAVYSSGSLIEFDVTRSPDGKDLRQSSNPLRLGGEELSASDLFGRPHVVFAHPDGEHIIVGGNPSRARAGGGMLIYNVETDESQLLGPEALVPDQGIMALCALPNGNLVGGTLAHSATGGKGPTGEAQLFTFDFTSRKVLSQLTPIDGARQVRDLVSGPNGLIYGIASNEWLFIFDPAANKVVHREQLRGYGSNTGRSQAPRVMAVGDDMMIYILFRDAIVQLHPETRAHEAIARPSVPITAGIAIQGGRLYFASEGSLWSFALPKSESWQQ